MLNSFSADWNSLYAKHPCEYKKGGVTITEKGTDAKNKSLTVTCAEAISFPSKQFDCFDLFSSLTNRNCDSVLLVKNDEGSYDLVYIEMKSRFDSHECFEAKCQIAETSAKMQTLFRMMKSFATLPIRKVYGVIEHKQLDADQADYRLKLQQLPDSELDFGWKLIKYGTVNGKTLFKPALDMPDSMTFIILLSDKSHFTVDYSEICKRT